MSSLKQRFGFLDIDPLYIHSAILTPKYGKKWMNRENERINFNNDTVVSAADEFLMKFHLNNNNGLNNNNNRNNLNDDDAPKPPPAKRLKNMDFLNQQVDSPNSRLTNSKIKTLTQQLREYLQIIACAATKIDDTRQFWLKYKDQWPELAAYAKYLLTVPASSAAVERVFSVGGAILRPSRRRLADKNIRMLIF